MEKIDFGKSGIKVPNIAVGCMRIASMSEKEVRAFVDTAMSADANFFDHADIYGGGQSEEVFGKAIKHLNREDIIIQTKCGIVPGMGYDFSYEHIVDSVEKSLKRLDTDYIDVLLLHRPDALMEPCEVARAFSDLKNSGKVKYFGVSNQSPYQMELISRSLDMPLCANQVQMSIKHTPMIEAGVNVNMYNDSAVNRDGGILDYCRLNKITVQAWSPLQNGFFKGCFVDSEEFPELNSVLSEIAEKYNVTKTGIAIAWLLRHPAKIQAVTGTTNAGRLKECLAATDIKLDRADWYIIYKAAGNTLP